MPKAVEKTINAVVMALIEPIYFTPYISAQVDEPKTLARPLEIPIRPKKTKEKNSELNKYKITAENNNGIFVNNNNFTDSCIHIYKRCKTRHSWRGKGVK